MTGHSLPRALHLIVAAVVCAGTGILSGAAIAQPSQVPASRQQITLSFAPVVKQVAPAVVNIYTRTVVQSRGQSPFLDDPFFRRFFGVLEQAEPQVAAGSGVIVDAKRGYVITNAHVVKDAEKIR